MDSIQGRIERARSDAARLGAVRRTGLVGAPPTEALDRLTLLASKLLEVPATFISLVEADRDFYVSHCGFAEPLATDRELGGTTFCHHAMVHDGALVIDDTHADPVYRAVPTVQSLGVAAYLGIPMKSAQGEIIGSFCAIDFKPRSWSARDLAVMEELAASALREITMMEAIGQHVRKADEAEAARLAVEETIRVRRDILNSVSHDLRDPLNAIVLALGPIEALPMDERAKRSLAIVRRQAARMARLLEDLLDVARIDGPGLRLEMGDVDLAALLLEVAADFAPQAEAAGVAIHVDAAGTLPHLRGDRARLAQALANLMSNALKFTPCGGEVRLLARDAGDSVRVELSDTGRGIDPAMSERIFEPFWQANPADRKGAGLGLHIVRGIVEAHGGTIVVRSRLGVGSTFEISLPWSRLP